MTTTPIDRPSDLGQLLRRGRARKKFGRAWLALQANWSEQALRELEFGLLNSVPIVTLELLRQRLELDPVEVDVLTGTLWRDPPRGGYIEIASNGFRRPAHDP